MCPGAAGVNVEALEGFGLYGCRQEEKLHSSLARLLSVWLDMDATANPESQSSGNKIIAAERSLGCDQGNCEKGQKVSVPDRAID
jgi:hypothetical protein